MRSAVERPGCRVALAGRRYSRLSADQLRLPKRGSPRTGPPERYTIRSSTVIEWLNSNRNMKRTTKSRRRTKARTRSKKKDPLFVDGKRPRPMYVDYKDIELLTKLVNRHGRIVGRRKTGCSAVSQHAVTQAIKRARYMALLSYEGD